MLLYNLRHVAKYHGFNLRKMHPQVFDPPTPNSFGQSPAPKRTKIGPTAENQAFLDYFDMGNDVDRNDPAAVAEEKEIAKLHKSIDHGLYAALASGSLSEAL